MLPRMSLLLTCRKRDWRLGAESYTTSRRDALRIWDTAPAGRKVQCGLKRGMKWSLSIVELLAVGWFLLPLWDQC